MKRKGLVLAALVVPLLLALAPLAVLLRGRLQFKRLEPSITATMDQVYLNMTVPGREEYLLGEDEVFEVPYMASRLSVSAVPTRIYDGSDRLIGEFVSERGVYVRDPEELPVFLKRALVATEDADFYRHRGFSPKALARAALANLAGLRLKQGGSTLTQQLAKLLFTTRKKTVGRKAFELFCARKLESKFTKDQILLMYLNLAYFGHGSFGIESAARFYFGKPARALELGEAAMLAGIIASPNRYSPFENPELARARHRTVLKRMAKTGSIPAASVERYSAEFWRAMEERLNKPDVSFWRMRVNEAPYFVEHVRRELERAYGKERLLKGGLKVRTTLDLELQRAAQAALKAGLEAENRDFAAKRPGVVSKVEGAAAAVRPSDGAILAWVGGSAFTFQSQLDRAADIRRPMGSAVKPFVYAVAFESGFSPEDTMVDEPVRYRRGGGGRAWAPQNYEDKYYGPVTLRTALHKSLNSVAIRLLEKVDLGEVTRLLSEASGAELRGFPRDLSLALGTAGLSPLQMAAAFAVFANGGLQVRPYAYRSIEDRDGKVLAEGPAAGGTPKRLLKAETCGLMIDVMRGVLREGGTAWRAAQAAGFNLPAAGKTGTTNDYRDAWFAGATPDLAAAVWVGHDDMRVALGPGKSGGAVAAPIWMRLVKESYRHRPTREFDLPSPKPPEKVESAP